MIISIFPEGMRDPSNSNQVTARLEQADGCFGEWCGQYTEVGGEPLRPKRLSHMVVTGHDPETSERCYPVVREE